MNFKHLKWIRNFKRFINKKPLHKWFSDLEIEKIKKYQSKQKNKIKNNTQYIQKNKIKHREERP